MKRIAFIILKTGWELCLFRRGGMIPGRTIYLVRGIVPLPYILKINYLIQMTHHSLTTKQNDFQAHRNELIQIKTNH